MIGFRAPGNQWLDKVWNTYCLLVVGLLVVVLRVVGFGVVVVVVVVLVVVVVVLVFVVLVVVLVVEVVVVGVVVIATVFFTFFPLPFDLFFFSLAACRFAAFASRSDLN